MTRWNWPPGTKDAQNIAGSGIDGVEGRFLPGSISDGRVSPGIRGLIDQVLDCQTQLLQTGVRTGTVDVDTPVLTGLDDPDKIILGLGTIEA